jgi:hypothetical protein
MSKITDSNILSALVKFDGKYLLSYLPSYDSDAKWAASSINFNLNFFEISALQAYVRDVRDKIIISNVSSPTSTSMVKKNPLSMIVKRIKS